MYVRKDRWTRVVVMTGKDWQVFFYQATLTKLDVHMISSMTDEEVVQISVVTEEEGSHDKLLPNLSWLLPLCLDKGVQLPLEIRDVTPMGMEGKK